MRKRSAAASKDATVSKLRSILPDSYIYDDGYYDDGEDDNHYDGEGFMLHNWLHHQKQYNDGSGQR